ncbi:MAG TPA: thioredoxin family protein [Patescibacteria group bacterium]|nr:thioredoxin family protein [Patescibacteria group bacterium]
MAEQFFLDKIPHNGLTYPEFVENLRIKVEMPDSDDQASSLAQYLPLNLRRMKRIEQSFRPNPGTQYELMHLRQPQLWMVITEDWCGDSAQTLPIIAKLASAARNVDLRILERDLYPDIMDKYLTNGSRSIPILVAFDMEGNELFKWGPRPAEAASLVRQARERGDTLAEYGKKLHAWYAEDAGHTTEREILDLLRPQFKKKVEAYDEPDEDEFDYKEDLLVDLDEIKAETDFMVETEGLDGEETTGVRKGDLMEYGYNENNFDDYDGDDDDDDRMGRSGSRGRRDDDY